MFYIRERKTLFFIGFVLLLCVIGLYLSTEKVVTVDMIQGYSNNMSVVVMENYTADVGGISNIESVELDTLSGSEQLLLYENEIVYSLSGLSYMEITEEYSVGNYLSARDIPLNEVGNILESVDDKYVRVFGEVAEESKGNVIYYTDDEIAEAYMVDIVVKVWNCNVVEQVEPKEQEQEPEEIMVYLDEKGYPIPIIKEVEEVVDEEVTEVLEWYTIDYPLTVHHTLEETFKLIFAELYKLPEEDRVPIYSMGAYNYRSGNSAHTCGTAIDINPTENAEMTITGVITCGRFWDPDRSIYSIPEDSELVRIFRKYGFEWGGDWTSKKDYMHFSYLEK